MSSSPPITTTNPIADARKALLAVRQYQRDWQRYGVDRVRIYFDGVNGDWLNDFDKD